MIQSKKPTILKQTEVHLKFSQPLLFLTIYLSCFFADAQTFKILKIQGKKAIVEVNDPSQIHVNDIFSLDDDSVSNSSSSKTRSNITDRHYGLGMDFSFSNLKADATNSEAASSLSVNGSFLWNFKFFEIGPTLGFGNYKQANSENTTTSFGVVGFYNFTDNKPQTEHIFSVTAAANMSSANPSTGNTTTTTTFVAGPNYRWFVLSQDHCLSISALYSLAKTTGGVLDTTTTGFKVVGGIATYF